MTEIEKINQYISKRESGKFPIDTPYQMCPGELIALANMERVDAICLAFDYGMAKGYRAAKAEGHR